MPSWPTPYYACIFTSQRTDSGDDIYQMVADEMFQLATGQPGFLGVESVRDESGLGITVSYWQSRDAIRQWGAEVRHRQAQALGRTEFYSWFQLRIAEVTEVREFDLDRLSDDRPSNPPAKS